MGDSLQLRLRPAGEDVAHGIRSWERYRSSIVQRRLDAILATKQKGLKSERDRYQMTRSRNRTCEVQLDARTPRTSGLGLSSNLA